MNRPLPLSIAVITLNEGKNLGRCLASVKDLAGEIVVVDSGSTDDTEKIARSFGARFEHNPWECHASQKNAALGFCRLPWTLSLDADEEVSPELAGSIRAELDRPDKNVAGYFINRRTWFLDDWIRHLWYPEWRLRLIRTGSGTFQGRTHDYLTVAGETARLAGDLHHYPYADLGAFARGAVNYARWGAEQARIDGKKFRWSLLLLGPPFALFKQLVIRQGWRDGRRGLLIAFFTAWKVFLKYAFLLESSKEKGGGDSSPTG